MNDVSKQNLRELQDKFKGSIEFDDLHKAIYATDASVYRILPLGVAYPKSLNDIRLSIDFATKNNVTLIPRAAGTSLAGQCVGEGLVVDISKHFTNILAFSKINRTVTVQPGVVRDELNAFLKPHGLFFAPNTSTSNRSMIGGMVGNNSSGSTSIQFGVTRDKVIALKTVLSDGSEVEFKAINAGAFREKRKLNTLEGDIYRSIYKELIDKEQQTEILKEYPKKEIHRRNNGYAVDLLLDYKEFGGEADTLNLATILSGSEGTLAFITEITLQLDVLPPKNNLMIAAHFSSIKESMLAVTIAIKYNLYACELMDKTILDCTKNNKEQIKNRFFLEGDPKAILMLEMSTESEEVTNQLADKLIAELKEKNLGYAFPKLVKEDIEKAFSLRKAGLGLLGNIVGDKKAVACIEDTAVEVKDLPDYIDDFTKIMEDYGQEAVYYAHAGAGELHLRPILNLKKKADVILFRKITTETAQLVKRYGGSFSGEHGDGIVRAEFIPMMIGDRNYKLIRRIKQTFDPHNIFNKGKIVDPLPMDDNLRYKVERVEPQIETIQDFSDTLGVLRATEKCNGSGDCRKPVSAGGTMCPSYRVTKNEKETTRARANALREFLSNSEKKNKFNHKELYEVFDLCLSCKACLSECPSSVDIASLKSEFLYQYQRENGLTFRTKIFAENNLLNRFGSIAPDLTNTVLNSGFVKNMMGIAKERVVPKIARQTLNSWYQKNKTNLLSKPVKFDKVYLFVDEFTNFYDVDIGKDCVELLTILGYQVIITAHKESGRSFISKGLLDRAKKIANYNVNVFKELITERTPLIGIEPSAILTFKDEYLRLADDKEAAICIAKYTYTIEEFIKHEFEKKHISSASFTKLKKEFKIHGHCHQKALSSVEPTFTMITIPENYIATIINSGCCGMAGSFGYEKEHYQISMQVGEDTLFPKIRNYNLTTTVVASGTSCRHQIFDGTKRVALHPVTVLRRALKD